MGAADDERRQPVSGPEGPAGPWRPWHAPPPPGYPAEPPPAARPDAPAVVGHEVPPWSRHDPGTALPPPSGPAPYGYGALPVVDRPWPAVPPPPPPGPPALTFWPRTAAWMGFPPDHVPRWGMGDVVLGMIAFLAGSFVAGAAVLAVGVAATGEAPQDFARHNLGLVGIVGLLGSWGATVSLLWLVARLKGLGDLARDFGFRFTGWDPLIGLGGAIVTLVVSGIVQSALNAVTGDPPASNADAIFGDVAGNRALLLIMAGMASVGAPLVEELLFRGLALRAIEKRFGGVAAVVGSSVVFGLLHYQPGGPPQLALVVGIATYGLVFAVLTRWWGRLGPAVFAHLWINSLATIVVLAGVAGP